MVYFVNKVKTFYKELFAFPQQGRNPDETVAMVTHIRESPYSPVVSIELEKKKPELAVLTGLADVLFISKEYASYHGYQSPEETCLKFRDKAKEKYETIALYIPLTLFPLTLFPLSFLSQCYCHLCLG